MQDFCRVIAVMICGVRALENANEKKKTCDNNNKTPPKMDRQGIDGPG
jgi:hypothetical protein